MEKSLTVGIAGVFLVVGTSFVIGDEKLSSVRSSDYFPLAIDARWEYEVVQPNVKTQYRLIVKVTDLANDPEGPVFSVSYDDPSLGRSEHTAEPEKYGVRKEGVFCLKCGGFLLKDPLTVGASWQSGGSDTPTTSKVIEIKRKLLVGVSTYEDCIVIESRDQPGYRVVTTFARGIGPVDIKYLTPTGGLARQEIIFAHDNAPIPRSDRKYRKE